MRYHILTDLCKPPKPYRWENGELLPCSLADATVFDSKKSAKEAAKRSSLPNWKYAEMCGTTLGWLGLDPAKIQAVTVDSERD